MASQVADLVATLRADVSDFESGMNTAASATSRLLSQASSNTGLKDLTNALSSAGSMAAGAFATGLGTAIDASMKFDQTVQQSIISYQGLGDSIQKAQAQTQQGIQTGIALGIDPSQMEKAQELLTGLVGSYASTTDNLTKLAGAAATSGQPIQNVTDQVARLANIMASNPSSGLWFGMQLASQNIESFRGVTEAQSQAAHGAAESQIFQTLMANLNGSGAAAQAQANTLKGVMTSLKAEAESGAGAAFEPLYNSVVKALSALKQLGESNGAKEFIMGLNAAVSQFTAQIDPMIAKVEQFARVHITPQGADQFLADLKQMVPLLTTLGGIAQGDMFAKIFSKIPVLGDVLGPFGALLGMGGGALGGALMGTQQGRKALEDIVGSVGQVMMAVTQALPSVAQFFQIIATPLADLTKLSAGLLSLAADFKPLDDAVASFIGLYAGIRVWEGAKNLFGTVAGAVVQAEANARKAMGVGGAGATEAENAANAAAAQIAQARAQAEGSLAEAEMALSEAEAAHAEALATWTQGMTDANVTMEEMATFSDNMTAAYNDLAVATENVARAQDVLNAAMAKTPMAAATVETSTAAAGEAAAAEEVAGAAGGMRLKGLMPGLMGAGVGGMMAYAGMGQSGTSGWLTTILGGAMSGASLGMMAGPWGALIGGLGGAGLSIGARFLGVGHHDNSSTQQANDYLKQLTQSMNDFSNTMGNSNTALQQMTASANAFAGEAKLWSDAIEGKTGLSTFSISMSQVEQMQSENAGLKKQGFDTGQLEADTNRIAPYAGMILPTAQYLQMQLQAMQETQKNIELNEQLANSEYDVTKASQQIINAFHSQVEAQQQLVLAQMQYNEAGISQQDALRQMNDALQGFTDKYADLNSQLDRLTPAEQQLGESIVDQANALQQADDAYTQLNNQYTLMQDSVDTLKESMQALNDIANAQLPGEKQANQAVQNNKMQQDALQMQIDQAELKGANTRSVQIINMENQLDVLKKIGDTLQLQNDMTYGNEKFNIQQAQLGTYTQTYQQELQAAEAAGKMNTQLQQQTQSMDQLKTRVDQAKESYDKLNQTVTPEITALQNLEKANRDVITTSQALSNAQNQMVNATNGVTDANHQYITATQQVQNVQAQMREQTLTDTETMVNAINNYVSDYETALGQLQQTAQQTADSVSNSVGQMNNALNSMGSNGGGAGGGGGSSLWSDWKSGASQIWGDVTGGLTTGWNAVSGFFSHFATGGLSNVEQLAWVSEGDTPELHLPLNDLTTSRTLLQQYAPELLAGIAGAALPGGAMGPGASISVTNTSGNGGITLQQGAVQVSIEGVPGAGDLQEELQQAIENAFQQIYQTMAVS